MQESLTRVTSAVDQLQIALKKMHGTMRKNLEKIEGDLSKHPDNLRPVTASISKHLSFSRFAEGSSLQVSPRQKQTSIPKPVPPAPPAETRNPPPIKVQEVEEVSKGYPLHSSLSLNRILDEEEKLA